MSPQLLYSLIIYVILFLHMRFSGIDTQGAPNVGEVNLEWCSMGDVLQYISPAASDRESESSRMERCDASVLHKAPTLLPNALL